LRAHEGAALPDEEAARGRKRYAFGRDHAAIARVREE
jgi:hypothetical protein